MAVNTKFYASWYCVLHRCFKVTLSAVWICQKLKKKDDAEAVDSTAAFQIIIWSVAIPLIKSEAAVNYEIPKCCLFHEAFY